MAEHGEAERRLTCRLCGKAYKSERALERHAAAHEKREGLGPAAGGSGAAAAAAAAATYCDFCQRGFKTRRQHAKHQYTVHGVNVPVDCGQCSPARTFESEKELAAHKAEVHSHRASCEQCGKVYFSTTILENHIR